MTSTPAPIRRLELFLAIVLAPAFTLLFFHYALGEMVYFRDLFHEFYPMKVFLAEQLKQGRLPLWNPYPLMGMPYMAELSTACFYPLNLLFLFLSPLEGLRYYLLLHYPLAAVGMYLLLRDLELRPAAAALGAMTFAFSGYLVAQHCNLIYLISPCYFPWTLFCFRRIPKLKLRWAVAAGACIALPFLAGEPQGAAIAAVTGLFYAILTAPPEKKRFSASSLALLLAPLLVAAGLCMIQFLPAWELNRYTERAHGLPLDKVTCWSFYPLRLLEFIWPELWGLPWPEDRFWGGFMTDWCFPLPWTLAVYLGLWPLLAAGLALGARNRQVLFFAGLSLLALLLSFGRYTPFFTAAYYLVPGLSLFRYPEKYLALFSFGLAALAGLGTHRFLEQIKPGRGFPWAARILLGVLVILALAAWISQQGIDAWFKHFLQQPRVGHINPADATDVLLWALTRTGAAALILGLILEISRRKPLARKWLPALLILLTALDLYTAHRPQVPTAPTWLYTRRSLAAELIRRHQAQPGEKYRNFRDSRLEYSYGPLAESNLPTHILLRVWQKDTLKPNWNMVLDVEEMTGYTPAAPELLAQLWKQGMDVDMLRSFNIKYALVAYDWSMFDAHPGVRPLEYDQANNFRLLLFEGYFPRAYVVPHARAVATEAEAADLVQKLDLREEAVLITSEPLPPQTGPGVFVPAQVLSYEPDRVELLAQTEHPGWLVLADTYFPGWEARVNGKPARIFRANYLARAVAVGQGRNQVEFIYQPQSYLWGRALTLATLGLVLAGILVEFIMRRSSNSVPHR